MRTGIVRLTFALACAPALFPQDVTPGTCATGTTDVSAGYGALATCDIGVAGEADTFRFTATAGETVLVQVTRAAGVGQPYFEIYNPLNTRVDAQGSRYSAIARTELKIVAGGEHWIVVRDADNNETLTYQLYVERLSPPRSPTGVTFGQPVTSDISFAGGVKLFTFNGNVGETILVQATRTAGAGQPYFEIYGPNDVRLDAQGSRYSAIARSEARLTMSGQHVVRLYDADVNEALTVQLYVQRLSPPESATAITFGEAVTTDLAFPGAVKMFTFNATAGQVVLVQATRAAGAGQPYFEIYGPNGVRLDAQGTRYSAIARSEARVTASGQHVVRVYDADVNEPVTLQIYVQRLAPPESPVSLTFGQATISDITFAGGVKLYTFNGNAGETMLIQASKTAGAGQPYFEVYGPNDVRLDAQGSRYSAIARSEVRLTATGTHVVRVYDADVNEPVTLQVYVQRLTPPGAATAVTFGQPLTSDITVAGGVGLFTFSATAGQIVMVQATRTAGAGQPYLELYGANDVRLDAQGSRYSAIARSEVRLTSSGQHVVRLYDADFNETVTLQLYVQRLSPPESPSAVNFGEPITSDISSPGAVKLYTFNGAAGQVMLTQATRTAGSGQPYLEVYGPGDVRLDAQGSRYSAIARSVVRLTSTGQHVVRVYDADFNEALTVQTYIDRIGPPVSSTPLTFARQVSGSILYPGQVRSYTFGGASSDVVSIQVARQSGVGTPYFELYDQTYTQVLARGDRYNAAARSDYTLLASGTYTLQIYDADFNEALAFTVQADCKGKCVPPDLRITTTSPLSDAALQAPYSQNIQAAGGTSPYRWSLAGGAFPRGVSIDAATGVITGTPAEQGRFTFTIRVTDAVNATADQVFDLNVLGRELNISTASPLPAGAAGAAYSSALAATGGVQPYTWSLSRGNLPAGIELDSPSSVLRGLPTSAETFSFSLTVTDSSSPQPATVTKDFVLTVTSLPRLSFADMPGSVSPDNRAAIALTTSGPHPVDIAGEVRLEFTPDAVNNMDDPAVMFLTGARTAAFTIPANSTAAQFEASRLEFQTGTVAGTVAIRVTSVRAGGTDMAMTMPSITTRVGRSEPTIRSVSRVTTASGFDVIVRGYSTTRDLVQADFSFKGAPGASLETTSLQAALKDASAQYFTSQPSMKTGGNFQLRVSLRVDGQVTAIGSISVALVNTQGRSQAVDIP